MGGDMQLVATGVRYFSQGDETSFFEWLRRIECVRSVRGEGRDLFIEFGHSPTDEDLREIVALFFRYDVDMRQLAVFAERDWLRNPEAFWYQRVFA